MMWNFLQSLTGYLPEAFTQAALTLASVETGLNQLPDRWKRCLDKADLALGFASSALYVQDNFSPSSKQKVLHRFFTSYNCLLVNFETDIGEV